ncbi:MAG TPA: hypothetical protein VJS66_07380 [Burkholderiales bacterium]|nr:hypothetical protein [Burkholderiales bacterium]
MGKNAIQDDEQLGRLVSDAYDGLPDIDSIRQGEIESRIVAALPHSQNPRRTPSWYWWLLAVLATGAAASWWVGEHIATDSSDDMRRAPTEAVEPSQHNALPLSPPKQELSAKPSEKKGSRMIYRREGYAP